MPTAPAGRPDRSSSGDGRKVELSKDDERLLEDGVPADDERDDLVDAADTDDVDADDDREDDERSGGATLTKTRREAGSTTTTGKSTSTRGRRDQRSGNPISRILRFLREVVGEMRKVLWPSRRELVVYTIAVLIFVTILIAIVGGLDFGFARLVLLVFG